MPNPMDPAISELTVQILNIISDPIFIKNNQLQFIFVNDAFCALCNRSREAFLGRTLFEISYDTLAESTGDQEKSVLETGMEQTCKLEIMDAEGNSRTLDAKRIRLTDKTEKQYVFCIMKSSAATQPPQTQKPQSISKSGTPITREAIHDLNNSLNIIRGYSELLLEDLAADDLLHKDLNAIYQAGRHAADIAAKF
jgi:nitrogen-specific signal transduction histidine kinase